MTHGMDPNAIFNAGFFAGIFINAAHRFVRQCLVFFMLIGGGEQVGFGCKRFIIVAQFWQEFFGKQCIALFVALAFNLDQHSFAVDVFGFEVNGFTGF